MKQSAETVLFSLLQFELFGTPFPNDARDAITPERLPRLYALSKSHDMSHLVADALEKLGLLPADHEVTPKFQKQHMLAIYRYQQISCELSALKDCLEQAQIPFLPLKGSVIRSLYPEGWMRTSSDIDVLVHPDDLDRATALLIEQLGYRQSGRATHDVSFYSPSRVHVELHYSLIEDDRAGGSTDVLETVWQNATLVEGTKATYEMQDAMFYFYHVAHMAKHLESGGCGIRPFVDLYLLDRDCSEETRAARRDLLRQGGLEVFSKACSKLSQIWFGGAELDELSKRLESYILTGGVFGSVETKVAMQRNKKGGRVRYIFSRIFLPMSVMREIYPVLKKHPILLPACHVRRWFSLIRKGRFKHAVMEIGAGGTLSKETVDTASRLLRDLEL